MVPKEPQKVIFYRRTGAMKSVIILMISLVLLSTTVSAQETETTTVDTNARGDLTIIIIGFKNDNGDVKVALSNSAEEFSSKPKDAAPFRADLAFIKDKKAQLVFKDLPFGEYAVRLFHDENGNGKIDTNFLGIPKENYGFSNNARASFGPPKYEKAKFDFQESQTIEISVQKPKKE
jgi:uncharacterized protein (DUF2141 family)